MPEEEIWKDIPGYDDRYQVSNLGRVKSKGFWVEHPGLYGSTVAQYYPPRILKARSNGTKCGHLLVAIGSRTRGDRKKRYVHALVAEAFIGPRPEGMVVCHNDSDPTNNCASNLRYDTKSGNAHDMLRLGNGNSQKLSENDIVNIRKQLADGRSPKDIASDYGTTPELIRNIRRGVAWGWLQTEVI